MASLEARFRDLASRLEPTDFQKKRAQQAHVGLRERLPTGKMKQRVRSMYLSGSYVRSTALRPLEDVDVIAEINREHWDRGLFRQFLNWPPAAAALTKTFADSVRRREGGRGSKTTVRQQRVSVGVVKPSLTVDVVPAIVHPRKPDWLRIPNRISGKWIDTAPRIHGQVTADLNARHDGRFVPLVKIAKGWNRAAPSTARMKGFAIEVIAAHVFTAYPLDSLEQGFELFCDFLASFGDRARRDWSRPRLAVDLGRSEPVVPDTAGAGCNVVAGVEAECVKKFIKRACQTRDALEKGSRERTVADGWASVAKLFKPRKKARPRSKTGGSPSRAK